MGYFVIVTASSVYNNDRSRDVRVYKSLKPAFYVLLKQCLGTYHTHFHTYRIHIRL